MSGFRATPNGVSGNTAEWDVEVACAAAPTDASGIEVDGDEELLDLWLTHTAFG